MAPRCSGFLSLLKKTLVLAGEINLVDLNQLRILPGQLPEAFNLCLKILPLVEGIPVKMIYPGISIQQADVYLRPKLCFCLGFVTDDGSNMQLMNAQDEILYLMYLLVHCLLLFQQMLYDKKTF